MPDSHECPYCKSLADPAENLTYLFEDKEVSGLKGWRCSQCGAVLYNEESVALIEKELDT